ncbi:unnamed protein product [Symbiodinium sp. CCMP2592]|nr:unnamed protein product [Symbiodinium sp. CCMP2592]
MHDKQICVLSDINDRLPPEARQILDGMLPTGEKVSAEAAAAAYASMFAWLRDQRSWVFPSQPTCHCIVHEGMCPVFPQGSDAGQRSCTMPSQQKLRVNVAGTTCIGWSQAGKGLHFADPSERPHAIWATERLRRAELEREDVFFSECTPRYPVKEKLGFLDETHELLSVKLDPMMLGWPVRRTRLFTVGLNKRTMAWLGPDQDDVAADFLRFYGVDLKLTADVFLVATDDEVAEAKSTMAARRGFSGSSNQQLKLHEIYAPGHLLRYQDYDKYFAECVKSGQISGKSFFADLDQNLGRGASTPGEVLPSCLTHWTIHAWSAARMVLNQEVYLAHGFNLYPEATGWPVPCSMRDVLKSLANSSQKQLVGNGWHLPALAAFMFYVLAHTVRLDRNASIEPEKTLLRRGGSDFSGLGSTPSRLSVSSLDGSGSDLLMGLQSSQETAVDDDEDSQKTLILGCFR